jgi:hypothetical protein
LAASHKAREFRNEKPPLWAVQSEISNLKFAIKRLLVEDSNLEPSG